uniref:Uncharacterized protein n=1 Tax=Streptomyces avermitilis TaxID=33903 RepID=A0A499W755_STRAX|nr:hypothetical protein SAVMC3_89680 [Streptomyces avermitilis]
MLGKNRCDHVACGSALDHRAFRELVESFYSLYAQVFLEDEERDTAVSDTFDILWLCWNDALASPDTRKFAWNVLRATVMARTPHVDGRPNSMAAFDTVALQSVIAASDRAEQIEETLDLFKAMSVCPTTSSTSWCCAACAGSPRDASGFSVSRWPLCGPTSATPSISWRASSAARDRRKTA